MRRDSGQSSSGSFVSFEQSVDSAGAEKLVDKEQLQLHALLEFILEIRWLYVDRPDDAVLRFYKTNKYSHQTDSAREGRWNPLDLHNTTRGNPVSLSEFTGNTLLLLDFSNVDAIIQLILSQCLSCEATRKDFLKILLSIAYRCSESVITKHLVTNRIYLALGGSEKLRLPLEDLVQTLMNHCTLTLSCPELYGGEAVNAENMAECLYRCAATSTWSGPLILKFVENLQSEETDVYARQAVQEHFFDHIYDDLSGFRLTELKSQPLHALNIAIQSEFLREELVKRPYWSREEDNGFTIMTDTLLGRLLRPTVLDGMRIGDEPKGFVSIGERYFKKIRPGMVMPPPPAVIHNLHTTHYGIIQQATKVAKALIRHGGEVRNAFWKWIANALDGNSTQSTLLFRTRQQQMVSLPRATEVLLCASAGISSYGFGFNVAWLLLELCRPITTDKVALLDPLYPTSCRLAKECTSILSDMENETPLISDEDKRTEAETKAPPLSGARFTTEVFWAALKAIRILLFQCFNDVLCRQKHLASLLQQDTQAHLRSSYDLPPDELEDLLIQETMCWNVLIDNQEFIQAYSHFLELGCGVLLRCAFMNTKEASHINPLLRSLGVTADLQPRSEAIPCEFAQLPSAYISDLFDSVSVFIYIGTIPIFSKKSTVLDTFLPNGCELFAAAVLFILGGPPTYIRNASLKLDGGARVLESIFFTERLLSRFSETRSFKAAFASAVIIAFIDAQKLSYYQRVDIRLMLTRELELYLGKADFDVQVKDFATNHGESFERFLHYFGANTSWLIEEALTILTEIKKREGQPDPVAEGEDMTRDPYEMAQQLSQQQLEEAERRQGERIAEEIEGVRNVSEMRLTDLTERCKSLMEASALSLSAFSKFQVDVFAFIRNSSVLLPQTILCLNSSLNSLVGPKCLTLKVANFEKYNFRPREFLARLCRIYISLLGTDENSSASVLEGVVKEERFFNPQLFAKAAKIVKREGLLKAEALNRFQNIVTRLTEYVSANLSEDAMFDADIPDDYLDPIMSELMRDPVMLPSSAVVVDRSTIERHLISDEFDPFNRAPLTKDKLIDRPDLKADIHEWILKHRRKCPKA